MVLAILLGVLAGAVGFAPLLVGLYATRRNPQPGWMAPMMKLMFGLIVSFIAIFMLAILFIACDRANGLPFVLAEVIALCVTAIGYGIWSIRRK